MTARRRPRRREAQLAFDALSIEGGLLSADWLARAAQLGAGGQSEADYRVPRGLNLRDEIGRYWRIAQAHWGEFAAGRLSRAEPGALAERFVHGLLRESFGFASLTPVAPMQVAERTYPVGAVALGGRVPVVVAAAGAGLDALSPAFGDGGRRRSAFGLAQEYLNASDQAQWGIASDGVTLRILRDNASLTRPSWIEADLGRIFGEERYADFAALWLLAHETRFGTADQPASDCALEVWRAAGREEGTRAREHLRRGVEDALLAFGHGFLAHPENQALRAALQDGSLTSGAYFQQLLRFVYRLIFLLTAEERGVLHPTAAPELARSLYAQGYGLRRLRDRSVRRSAYDRFGDVWEALKIVLRGMARGEERLGLPALGGLFDEDQCPALDAARLENRALLVGVFRLSWLREDGGLSRVNWRDMGPEELGSVYEGLLELVPQITQGGRVFSFATGAETKGNARKMTGSYYTPDSLVQVLLDSALEPVIQATIAANPGRQVDALLDLSIVDPACGSGHFLLSAARRLAAHVARLETNGTPSAEQYRHALRHVVGRCIFGVDLNPMAVELCKVSLWMEAVEPGRPLSFLDSHIQHGNALLGATPELMAKGIPEAAWEPIEGDDRKIASALKKQNKLERKEMTFEFGASPASTYMRLGAGARAVDEAADESLAAVESKEQQWGALVASAAYEHQRFVADLWCAAFVWRKETGSLRNIAPTDALFRTVQKDGSQAERELRKEVGRLSEQYSFFHWHLAFPQVFARGGFDVVLGNPPWERVKLQEQEFFASRSGDIATAKNSAARKKLIVALVETDPALWAAWCAASREAEGYSQFVRQSGRYPLCGRGDVNTYALFAEHNSTVLAKTGRAGFVVPTGLVTDESTSEFLRALVGTRRLVSAFDFENTATAAFFPGVGNRRFKFCLATFAGAPLPEGHEPEFVFYAEDVAHLRDAWRRFTLSPDDFRLFNPSSRTCPVFRSRRDAALARRVYRQMSVIKSHEEDIDPWEVRFMSMVHMAGDSHLFKSMESLVESKYQLEANIFTKDGDRFLPLFEAKMIHLFDHRYGDFSDQPDGSENTSLPVVPVVRLQDVDYEVMPRYWVPRNAAEESLERAGWHRPWFFAWRDIANSGNERTAIFAVLPRVACGHTLPVLLVGTKTGVPIRHADCFQAMTSSLVFDYVTRLKNGGTHLTFGLIEQLPVLPPSRFEDALSPVSSMRLVDFIRPRVLELSYVASSLAGYAGELGYDGPPFHWDEARRAVLRAELDALFFVLLEFDRSDLEYVLDTFKRLRLNETEAHGEYRTKRLVLEIYDAIAEATRTGKAYETRLDPPPADPRVALPRARATTSRRG